ncbi:MAG: metallopeptidase [Verrucomicrobiae bacterium]|nr:metallopeptidase [Verrucomicrobiae bacterium]
MNVRLAPILFALSLVSAPAEEAAPIARTEQKIEGFAVRIDNRLLPGGEFHESFGRDALALARVDLSRISILMRPPILAELRKVVVVIDEHPNLKGMQYHPSRDWLVEHGHEASLARCVHISRASTYADPGHAFVQPSAMIHELAHAYHDQVLGFEDERVKAAFAAAEKSGKYEKILFVRGGTRRHYALTNHKEYFAEGTEAWFGTNDFFPFVRSELEAHDPTLHALLRDIWGERAKPTAP